MKALALAFLFIAFNIFSHGQQLDEAKFKTIKVDGLDRISVDNRGNVFYSDKKGNVFKLDASGEIVNHYSPSLQGRLNQLDAFSTMILFLFSADLQQVTLLDSHLVPIQTITFQDEGIGLVKTASLGNGHVFWLFDEVDLSLKKYDYRRGEILQVQPLLPFVGDDDVGVTEVLERDNLVLVHLRDHGLLVFDNQGNFIKRHAFSFDHPLAIYDGQGYFFEGLQLYRFDIHSGEKSMIEIPNFSVHRIAVSPRHLLMYSDGTLFFLPLANLN